LADWSKWRKLKKAKIKRLAVAKPDNGVNMKTTKNFKRFILDKPLVIFRAFQIVSRFQVSPFYFSAFFIFTQIRLYIPLQMTL